MSSASPTIWPENSQPSSPSSFIQRWMQPTGERSRRFAEASSLARSAVEATEQSEGRKHSRSLLPYCERQHKEDSTPPIFSSRCYERLNPSFRRDLGRPLNEKPGKQILQLQVARPGRGREDPTWTSDHVGPSRPSCRSPSLHSLWSPQ